MKASSRFVLIKETSTYDYLKQKKTRDFVSVVRIKYATNIMEMLREGI